MGPNTLFQGLSALWASLCLGGAVFFLITGGAHWLVAVLFGCALFSTLACLKGHE